MLLDQAPAYEKKSQIIDARTLSSSHEILQSGERAEILHIYAPIRFPAALLRGVKIPYVASGSPSGSFSWWKPPEPGRRTLPLGADPVPEAVSMEFFELSRRPSGMRGPKIIGGFRRKDLDPLISATLNRIQRFRSDVSWRLFDTFPTPDDIASVDVWVDPAVAENDFDGGTAEAIVLGVPVVASRTSLNRKRLAEGRSGSLVPLDDPNELAHAILGALFKPEVSAPRAEFGLRTRDQFRPEHRAARLMDIYGQLVA